MALYTLEQLDDMIWYFAHPYTVKDKDGKNIHVGEQANFQQACMKTAELMKRGYYVFSPVTHTHPVHAISPEFIKNNEYKLWMKLDELVIEKTKFSGIILAPNWETSSGCKSEIREFEKRKLQVLLYDNLMLEPVLYDAGPH